MQGLVKKMNKDQIFTKIKKCLQQVKFANGNGYEIASMLMHIQDMMGAYNLFDSSPAEKINDVGFKIPLAVPVWHSILMDVCEQCFGVKGYAQVLFDSDFNKSQHYYFFGMSIRPEFAVYTYKILIQQFRLARQKYSEKLEANGPIKNKRYRLDWFSEGMATGIFLFLDEVMPETECLRLDGYRGNLSDIFPVFTLSSPPIDSDSGDYAEGGRLRPKYWSEGNE